MKKLLLSIALVLTGCSHNNTKLAFQASDFDVARQGNESGTVTTITQKQQVKMDEYGDITLTPKMLKEAKKGFDEGQKLFEEKSKKKGSLFFNNKVPMFKKQSNYIEQYRPYYVVTSPFKTDRSEFITKNPKAEGMFEDLILIGAVAYSVFNEWTVFEGLRSKERQKKLVAKGVSWTFNSRHLIGLAMDILAKDKNGKFSFEEIHRLGMSRGVLYASYKKLKSQGLICVEWEEVSKWKKVRDLYHIQVNKTDACKERIVYIKRKIKLKHNRIAFLYWPTPERWNYRLLRDFP